MNFSNFDIFFFIFWISLVQYVVPTTLVVYMVGAGIGMIWCLIKLHLEVKQLERDAAK